MNTIKTNTIATAKTVISNEVFCEANEIVDYYFKTTGTTFCDYVNLPMEDDTEVFTWYIVSDYLAEKLIKHGEIVINVLGQYFWGCTSFGNPTYLEPAIQEIAKETENG